MPRTPEQVAADAAEPPLVMVEWIDTTNVQEWTPLTEVAEWAVDGGFVCRNVGYLVHEDDACVVLAARAAAISRRWTLTADAAR